MLEWQWEASKRIAADSRRTGDKRDGRVAVRSGHGVGKSAFAAWTVLWALACYYPIKIPCTAPTAHQLEDVLWPEIALWLQRLKFSMPPLADRISWSKDRVSNNEDPQNAFAMLRTARKESPEALQGIHAKWVLVIIDEASGVPEEIYQAGEGSLSTEGAKILMLSNPTRVTGYFYDAHHKDRDFWHAMRVNGETSPLQSQTFRDRLARKYGRDSDIYRVRVLGEFPRGNVNAVITLEMLEAAKDRDVAAFGPVIWGLDVARFGDDRCALAKRKGNAQLEPVKTWGQVDLTVTAGRVIKEYRETEPELRPALICVDSIGLGAGVADMLRAAGLPVVDVNVAEAAAVDPIYHRLKDELWFGFRSWLSQKNCKLLDDEDLIGEASAIGYEIAMNGEIKVWEKAKVKKELGFSPDVAEAFVLTFAAVPDARSGERTTPDHYED